MARIQYDGAAFESEPGETVLDCLLRNGQSIPHSCKAGVCQSCLLRKVDGDVPPECSKPLRATLAGQGYFLPCLCRLEAGAPALSVERPGAGLRYPVKISNILPLSDTVALVQIAPPEDFEYRAGQYVTLIRPDGLARSYSISSGANPNMIDLHIRHIPGGAFSEWIHRDARPGDSLEMQGPAGECYYGGIEEDKPILLAGTGTGLAPLFGILQDALGQGHQGPIWLYHGARDEQGLYLREMLTQLASDYPNAHYIPAVLEKRNAEESDGNALTIGKLDEILLKAHPNLKEFRVYLCGDPQIVNTLRTRLFLAGVPSREIFADPFVTVGPESAA